MPFRTSLLLSLSATSFLNSVLASSHINPHKHQECQSFNQLLDSFPDGSLHDTLADGIPGFEHTIFGNDREAAQALHDVDHEAAMKMLSVAHVDLVRRQILSSAAGLPASLAASVGVSVPTSLPEVIPTAAVSMPQSSAAPVVVTTQEVTSIVSVMPSSAPIASSAPPSAAPPSSASPSAAPPSSVPSSSDAASVAPVPISTTEAAPPPATTSEIIMSSTSAPPQESSGTTSPSDVAPVPVPSSTTPTSVGSTSFVQSTSASEALPSGSASSSAVPMSSETAMVTSTPGSTATSAIGAFPTAGSAMTTLTSSDFINLSSFAAPTSQAPVASSTPDATSAAVGGGGVVDGGSSSAAVVAPTSNQGGGGSPSTTAASNGNGGTGNNGGTGGAGGAGGNGGTGSNGGSDSGSVTTTDEFGDTLVVPRTTDGAVLTLTDSGGRVITTTYHPGGLARETRVLSSRLPGGGQTLITSVAYVNPSAASGIDGGQPSIATRTRGQAGLQTGNVADTTRRAGAEALALAVGAMGVAWAL